MEVVEDGQNRPRIRPKRINRQEIMENEDEDRFSALPDCLLVEILSRLPSTNEAIRTGTLSKRWEHLWAMVPTLIFNDDGENPLWPDIIDKTLTQCRQLKLKRFEVFTSYDIQNKSQVNNWICYAVTRNIEELSLRLDVKSDDEFPLDQYFFINSCFTDLALEGCALNPAGTIIWENLRSLFLFNVKLDEDLIENILSGSQQLETLGLDGCYGYRLLDITSKSVKKLDFYSYNDPEDIYDDLGDIIEINAPNILSLSIKGELLLWKLLLLNVSSLVEVELDYQKMGHYETTRKEDKEEMLKGFILNLRHVKELKIGSFCHRALSRLEAKGFNFPSDMEFPFAYLKHVEEADWSDSSDSIEFQDSDSDESEDW